MVKKVKKTQKTEEDTSQNDKSEQQPDNSAPSSAPPERHTPSAPATPSSQSLQVFVSGLPYESNEQQLREFFNRGDKEGDWSK